MPKFHKQPWLSIEVSYKKNPLHKKCNGKEGIVERIVWCLMLGVWWKGRSQQSTASRKAGLLRWKASLGREAVCVADWRVLISILSPIRESIFRVLWYCRFSTLEGVPGKGSCLRSRLKGSYFNTEFYSWVLFVCGYAVGLQGWNPVWHDTLPGLRYGDSDDIKNPSALTGTFPSQGRPKTHRSSSQLSPTGTAMLHRTLNRLLHRGGLLHRASNRHDIHIAGSLRWKASLGREAVCVADWRVLISILSSIRESVSACGDIAGLPIFLLLNYRFYVWYQNTL